MKNEVALFPSSQAFLKDVESGVLYSEYEEARKALETAAVCSYWLSTQDRVKQQLVHHGMLNSVGFGADWTCCAKPRTALPQMKRTGFLPSFRSLSLPVQLLAVRWKQHGSQVRHILFIKQPLLPK